MLGKGKEIHVLAPMMRTLGTLARSPLSQTELCFKERFRMRKMAYTDDLSIDNVAVRTDMTSSAPSSESINPLERVDRAPNLAMKGTASTMNAPTTSRNNIKVSMAFEVDTVLGYWKGISSLGRETFKFESEYFITISQKSIVALHLTSPWIDPPQGFTRLSVIPNKGVIGLYSQPTMPVQLITPCQNAECGSTREVAKQF